MSRDCKECFYYTWQHALLCAVEPALVNNACECRHYEYNPTYESDGIVVQDAFHLGYAVAARLPYRWEDHHEGGFIMAMVVVREDYGFMRAVDLPDLNQYLDPDSPWEDTGIMDED